MSRGWWVEHRVAPVAALHGGWPSVAAEPARRAVAVCRPTAPALVLGSTQAGAVVDPAAAREAGVEVVGRRSGGGAVLVGPDQPVWVDAWIPVGDPLWDPDVGRAFEWMGEAWVRALGRLGVERPSVHRGVPDPRSGWSALVCFGGVGAGEVLAADGRKIVGVAQRRSRAGAWFHSAGLLHWDPAPLLALLALGADERERATADLRDAAVGVEDLLRPVGPGGAMGTGRAVAARVSDAVVSALP